MAEHDSVAVAELSSEGANGVRSQLTSISVASSQRPHVLLAAPERTTARWSDTISEHACVSLLNANQTVTMLAPVDVAVIDANLLGINWSPLLNDPRCGYPELVFAVRHPLSPEGIALASRGYRYVIGQDDLHRWLPLRLARLATVAHARRVVIAASLDNSETPKDSEPSYGLQLLGRRPAMTLHAAESRFREIYMRSLLAEYGSRRAAAAAAGVPYRSFCEMLRKVGL